MSIPSLPYQGTDGHSGTETSEVAATEHKQSAGERQRAVMTMLEERGSRGVTVVDLRNTVIPHHGTASRVLTVLHIGGHVLRLKETRGKAKIYVLPKFRMARPIEVYRGTKAKHALAALEELQGAVERRRDTGGPSALPVYQMGWKDALDGVLQDIYRYAETLAGVDTTEEES